MTDTTTTAETAVGPGLQQSAAPTARGSVVYLNGRFVPRAEAAISVDDRGFLFADGVYEVTRALDGRMFEAARHRRRLERSLRGIEIDAAAVELDALDEAARRLLRDNDLLRGHATVYLQVTRGAVAPRAHYFPPAGTRPTVYMSASALSPPDELRARGAAAITLPDIRWARCDLKTLNLLPNALAKQHAVAAGAFEAIFVRDGVVLEGAVANVFAMLDGELRTAPVTNYILPGVTREVVIELARAEQLPVREMALLVGELAQVTELFVTSTTSDVMPIVQLDGRSVGDGAPGPVARRMGEALMARMR